jgi:hypothetical protein
MNKRKRYVGCLDFGHFIMGGGHHYAEFILMQVELVHVYTMKIIRWAFQVGSWTPTEHEWALVSSCIQLEEKEKIGRFVFRRDAKSSMAGRLLIRKFVSEVTPLRYYKPIIKV